MSVLRQLSDKLAGRRTTELVYGRSRNLRSSVEVEEDMRPEDIVHRDPEIMSGALVFVGTRVPVYNLFDYLEAGDSLDRFLASFPSVSREQAVAALELAKEAVGDLASAGR